MTKLFEEAIRKVQALPESDQDEAAKMLLSLAARRAERQSGKGERKPGKASSPPTRKWPISSRNQDDEGTLHASCTCRSRRNLRISPRTSAHFRRNHEIG